MLLHVVHDHYSSFPKPCAFSLFEYTVFVNKDVLLKYMILFSSST